MKEYNFLDRVLFVLFFVLSGTQASFIRGCIVQWHK